MKTLIIYDSAYGNTGKIAQAMAESVNAPNTARLAHVDEVTASDIAQADCVIVGSPTQGGRPTVKIQQFLGSLGQNSLRGKGVAAFDTRFGLRAHNFALRLIMKLVGFAAPRISKALRSKGGALLTHPEGFIVQDKTGPLTPGELDRAKTWLNFIEEDGYGKATPATPAP